MLQNGGEKEYDVLLNEYRTTKDADERNTALRSLGRARGEKLINRTLSLPLSDEVKGQDVYLPIASMRSEAEGITSLWDWMTNNWDAIKVKCPPSLTLLSSMVQICTSSFTKKEQEKMVSEFFNGKDRKGFERALGQSLDSVRAKSSWLERDGGDVKAYLEKQGYLDGSAKL